MAKKHKAATDIHVAGTAQESEFASFVHRYWKVGAAVTVAIAAAFLVLEYRAQQGAKAAARRWSELSPTLFAASLAEVSGDVAFLDQLDLGFRAMPARSLLKVPKVSEIQDARETVRGHAPEVWALLGAVHAYRAEGRYDEAIEALEELKQQKQPELNEMLFEAPDGTKETLTDRLGRLIYEQQRWNEAHADLHGNPPLPEEAPVVELETSAGKIGIGLYAAEAPEHAENFVKLAREGFYDGTKFHRVIEGFMVQGGDPNTKEGAFDTWGLGGPGYTIPREQNELYHFRGYVAAAKNPGAVESSGSQFYITTGAPHHLDGQHVVFGKVISGMEVVEAIEQGEIDDPEKNRPSDPVVIQTASVRE